MLAWFFIRRHRDGVMNRKRQRDSDKLPSFVFVRQPHVERQGDFTLSGVLFTDTPRDQEHCGLDHRLIRRIIQHLTERLEDEPELDVAGIWRDGIRPLGGIAVGDLESHAGELEERGRRCVCVNIRVAPPGGDPGGIDSEVIHAMSGGRA
jgi:hypothetical protein